MVQRSGFNFWLGFMVLAPAIFAVRVADACDCARLKPLTPDVKNEAPFIFEDLVLEIIKG